MSPPGRGGKGRTDGQGWEADAGRRARRGRAGRRRLRRRRAGLDGRRPGRRDRRREGGPDPGRGARRHGRRHLLRGQGHDRRLRAHGRALQRALRGPGVAGRAARVPGGLGQPARAGHPAPRGQVAGVRRLPGRHHLDRRVRAAALGDGPDRVRRGPRGRVHPLDARAQQVRRPLLGRPPGHRRRAAVPPDRPGRRAARQLAGALSHGGGRGRDVLSGRGVRGLDLQLPGGRVRGRRRAAVGGRQAGDARLAGEPRGAGAHGRRDRERRGAQGRDHVHGGAGAARVRGRSGHVHAQLELRVLAQPEGGRRSAGASR